MVWFLALLAFAVVGLAAIASTGRLGQLPPAVDDRPVPHFSGQTLTADDVTAVRFAVVPRGYAPSQVDELLDRLAAALAQQPGADAAMPTAAELTGVRFAVVHRGYAMSQVDDLLDRVAGQLAATQSSGNQVSPLPSSPTEMQWRPGLE